MEPAVYNKLVYLPVEGTVPVEFERRKTSACSSWHHHFLEYRTYQHVWYSVWFTISLRRACRSWESI